MVRFNKEIFLLQFSDFQNQNHYVAVVGMGYVGLPLAVALGKKIKVLGFDISESKIKMLRNHEDPSKELSKEQLKNTKIEFSTNPIDLRKAKFIIIAVPTPINQAKNPDLTPILKAAKTIGENLTEGSIVVLESTVYPGVTEEVLGPELAKHSGLKQGTDFKLGYSPERINPGDKEHTLENVTKVVAGEDVKTLEIVANIYELVVQVGVHRASSIKVAEAAKVIENTQRDINIALMNELSLIFNLMNIDTKDVLEAAGTKWNFLKFSPGLVGGHCIGVDPYYLTHKAKELGYNAEIILAGRRINDDMGKYVAQKVVKMLIAKKVQVYGAKVAVLGLTFKENVSDIRNSRVVDIIDELKSFGIEVYVTDPLAEEHEVMHEYSIQLTQLKSCPKVAAVVVATPHTSYQQLSLESIRQMHEDPQNAILADVKRAFDRKACEEMGINYFGL